jgi:hypothetical protein
MGYPLVKVEYSGLALNRNLKEINNVSTRGGFNIRLGTGEINLLNQNDFLITAETYSMAPGYQAIKFGDTVNIWFGYNGGPEIGSRLIFPGIITEFSQDTSTREKALKINIVNKTERLLSSLDSKDYPSGGTINTASAIIKDMITRINHYKKGGEVDITTNNVATTTKIINYAYNFKSAYDVISELSAPEFTNTGQYIYYLDTDNDLNWKPRPGILATTPTIDECGFLEFRAEKLVMDVVNAVILNAGNDLNGNVILVYAVNYNSVTELGFRWKYLVRTTIAKDTIAMYPSANNAEIRALAKTRAKAVAEWIVKIMGEPRWKIDAKAKGSTNYPGTLTQAICGEILKITAPSLNWTASNPGILRVTDIQQSFASNSGWRTIYELKEDDDTKKTAMG